jgi:putative tricarboxylic transport membrane protein
MKRFTKTAAVIMTVGLIAAACGGNDAPAEPAAPSQPGAAQPEAPVDQMANWPDRVLQFVIPTAAGGGLDTAFRQIQPFLEAEVGVPIGVEYRAGGQFSIGTTYVAEQGASCEPFMFHAIPDILFSYLTQDVTYTYESFYPLGRLTTEPSTLWVRNDARWNTMEELIEEARQRPGEISVSVANLTNADHLAVLQLQEQAGIQFNIISYDGGGPSRNAIIAGEVDAGMGGVFASQPIAQDARALAVWNTPNLWPELTDGAPAINEVIGGTIDDIGGAFGFFTSRECFEQFPQRHEFLANALRAATESEGYQSRLAAAGISTQLAYRTPEEFDEFIRRQIVEIETLLTESPELFGR